MGMCNFISHWESSINVGLSIPNVGLSPPPPPMMVRKRSNLKENPISFWLFFELSTFHSLSLPPPPSIWKSCTYDCEDMSTVHEPIDLNMHSKYRVKIGQCFSWAIYVTALTLNRLRNRAAGLQNTNVVWSIHSGLIIAGLGYRKNNLCRACQSMSHIGTVWSVHRSR